MNPRALLRRSLLVASAIAVAAVGIGCLKTRGPSVAVDAPAPQFKLRSNDGQEVELRRLVADGPAVIVFYRGFW